MCEFVSAVVHKRATCLGLEQQQWVEGKQTIDSIKFDLSMCALKVKHKLVNGDIAFCNLMNTNFRQKLRETNLIVS